MGVDRGAIKESVIPNQLLYRKIVTQATRTLLPRNGRDYD